MRHPSVTPSGVPVLVVDDGGRAIDAAAQPPGAASVRAPDVSVVVLSMGDRPAQLARALASVRAQRDVVAEVVVVWNGATSHDPLAAGSCDREIHLADNVGIPEGRNRGLAAATGAVVAFLDDDAELVGTGVLAAAIEAFATSPALGAVAVRIVDEDGRTAPRHVPRCGGASATRRGEVTGFLGGACIVRRRMFEQFGGFAGEFRYAMEETDLAWRALDAGWTILYEPDLVVLHPRTEPDRHPDAATRTARNRVWMAHRVLPMPVAVAYVVNWFVIEIVRRRGRRDAWRALLRGVGDGWRTRIGPRRPISWSTVWRMTMLGRPPVV